MNNLIEILISLSQISTFKQICISTINIASMKYSYSFKDPQKNLKTTTAKIFNLNLTKEVDVAKYFLE